MCDVVGIIEQGRMLAVGSVQEIQKGQQRHTWVRVRILGGAEALAHWLRDRGDVEQLSTDGELATFSHTGDVQSEADLLREIVEAGFRVAAFGSQQRSLEDVFMQVTEGLVS
jgi:ABC-2 type transport system ATP-binding protein